jgi:hypothetical protein
LIGYTDRPSAAQLVVYVATVAIILGLMGGQRARMVRAAPSSAAVSSRS